MAPSTRLLHLVLLLAIPSTSHAETRAAIRVNVAPVDLAADADTPLFGEPVAEAVGAYNLAAAAFNASHGHEPGSPMAARSIAPGDLGVRATLVTVAPALEAGHPNVFVRVEARFGFADDLRAYGVGFYPVNLAARLGRRVVAYVSGGGTASWLDRRSTEGELGALLTARAALGVRIGKVTAEVGYAAFVLGGLFDRGEIRSMEAYDPTGAEPPPTPTDAIAGGEQRGLVDLSFGVAFD